VYEELAEAAIRVERVPTKADGQIVASVRPDGRFHSLKLFDGWGSWSFETVRTVTVYRCHCALKGLE
jgi:hypothetical protein